MNIDFPIRFDQHGHTAKANYLQHIRNMIEQVLFTSPGERVNRPDFGSGLMQLVFEPNSDTLTDTIEATVWADLERWLGDVIKVVRLEASNVESKLTVTLTYQVLQTGELLENQRFELETTA